MTRFRRRAVLSLASFLAALSLALPVAAQESGFTGFDDPTEIERRTSDLLFAGFEQSSQALDWFAARGNPDAVAAILTAMRYGRFDPLKLNATLETLTGQSAPGDGSRDAWFNWMLWLQAHPEVVPNEAYVPFKLRIFQQIDPEFLRFFPEGGIREISDIRVEEMAWGGVRVDGIPPLDNPPMITVGEADYLQDDDLVFGVSLNGDIRAYPLRIMGWHEMMNDVIGGMPVALAYCTLCGAGVLYATDVTHPSLEEPMVFSSTGMLYRSNKLMFDRQTDTVWDHFAGVPVMGPLRGSGIALEVLPMVTTTWADWRATHPDTTVVSLETGFRRNYGSGVVYADYFASPDLMFPARLEDEALRQKDRVFGLRAAGGSKAWPLEAFEGGRVVNDRVGLVEVVLIGTGENRTVRAYERDGREFGPDFTAGTVAGPGGDWQVTEDALIGPDGERLARLPGHIAYWFAWSGNMGDLAALPAAGNG